MESKLQVIIYGGNRNVGFSTPILIRGLSTDPDILPALQKNDVIQNSWSCTNINTNSACMNIQGTPIPLSTTKEFKIGARQLEAYQAFIIELTGSKTFSDGSFKVNSA